MHKRIYLYSLFVGKPIFFKNLCEIFCTLFWRSGLFLRGTVYTMYSESNTVSTMKIKVHAGVINVYQVVGNPVNHPLPHHALIY